MDYTDDRDLPEVTDESFPAARCRLRHSTSPPPGWFPERAHSVVWFCAASHRV